MKAKEMKNKSNQELKIMLKELRFAQSQASSAWGRDKVRNKEAGITRKGFTKHGQKTSLQKDIRRNIARVLTILNERER